MVHHCCGLSGCSPPLTDLTGCYPSHEGFYIQAFNESVTFLTAGYHHDRLWTYLSVGLSPTRTAASFAAPDPYERHYRIRLPPWRIGERCCYSHTAQSVGHSIPALCRVGVGWNDEHPVEAMVAQRVYGLALGYEDLNDLIRIPIIREAGGKLAQDPNALLDLP